MRKESWGPLTGVLFVVVLIVAFAVGGEPPAADDGASEVVDWYVDNKDSAIASAIVGTLAALLLVFFANHLRRVFADAGATTVSATVLVGGAIVAIAAALDATITLAIAESVDDIDPTAVQGLQALWDNDFLPFALGIEVFLISVGIAVLTTRALPVWLGWVPLALALLGFTPIGFVAFAATALWIAIVSVMLTMRSRAGTPAPPPAAGA